MRTSGSRSGPCFRVFGFWGREFSAFGRCELILGFGFCIELLEGRSGGLHHPRVDALGVAGTNSSTLEKNIEVRGTGQALRKVDIRLPPKGNSNPMA